MDTAHYNKLIYFYKKAYNICVLKLNILTLCIIQFVVATVIYGTNHMTLLLL